MIPEVCRIKTTGFQVYATFKGSSLGYTGRTTDCETFFKFPRAENGFIGLRKQKAGLYFSQIELLRKSKFETL
jgi:hypothetical protein